MSQANNLIKRHLFPCRGINKGLMCLQLSLMAFFVVFCVVFLLFFLNKCLFSRRTKILCGEPHSCLLLIRARELAQTNKKANKTYFGWVIQVKSKMQSKRDHKATFILYAFNGQKVTREIGPILFSFLHYN